MDSLRVLRWPPARSSRRGALRRGLVLGLVITGLMIALSGCAAGELSASGAYAHACAAGGECAVYLTITNPTRQPDTLMAARSDVADRAELHRLTTNEQGDLMMQPVESVALPVQSSINLKPGSLHIMLFDLKKDLKAGDTFALTLRYENSGEHAVEVLVTPEH